MPCFGFTHWQLQTAHVYFSHIIYTLGCTRTMTRLNWHTCDVYACMQGHDWMGCACNFSHSETFRGPVQTRATVSSSTSKTFALMLLLLQ